MFGTPTQVKDEPPKTEHVVAPQGKKSCCVIGSGASGLTVMKELTSLGHSVKCFDENLRIGGVYTKSYDRTMLTTSSLLTAYSDYSDGREDRPKFWSARSTSRTSTASPTSTSSTST